MHWKDRCWSSDTMATRCEEQTHWKRPRCWKRLRAGTERGDRGWDGWMASLTQWTWVWANSGRYWRTGKPGVLCFMRSQRVRHDLATEQQQWWGRQLGIICIRHPSLDYGTVGTWKFLRHSVTARHLQRTIHYVKIQSHHRDCMFRDWTSHVHKVRPLLYRHRKQVYKLEI